ncbi:MAG: HPr family phosphocarrier protein [Clostridiales bacterium]|jgi:phosphotransferase system HPr-like phosphotransfer protein|nr:HPr family phosphocarrier protein [Clostridiales bacterium]
MTTVTIKLDTIDKVRNFVNTISHIDGDFDLVSGRYRVDAKSIMGIFSLDLSKPLELELGDKADAGDIKTALKDFIIG